MKILQIGTYDIQGGAARAAYRLHRGLREMGHDCRMLVRYKDMADDAVLRVEPKSGSERDAPKFFLEVVIQEHYIDSHRTDISNTMFSLPYPGYDLSTLPVVQEADIINLHWVARYQSPLTLQRLFSLGKPVVWTLHDQWPFTGGCHYAAGCEQYQVDCRSCPQLSEDPNHLPGALLKDKLRFFKDAPVTLVSPSRWMANCARESALFKEARVEVIPNSLETDQFRPLPKAYAKEKAGLPPDTITLLFGGMSGNEKRKGFEKLITAIETCQEDPRFKELIASNKISLVCFGHTSDAVEAVGVPVKALGYLESIEEVVNAYCAADIFVLPSLEDNLPNTMLEAMSCGTPVVAFDVGGIPEVVRDSEDGNLIPSCNASEMGKAILHLIFHPEQRIAMGQACRLKAEERYKLQIQAQKYAALYEELINSFKLKEQPGRDNLGNQVWSRSNSSERDPLSAPVTSIVGAAFKKIYNPVLYKSLKEFSFHVHQQLQAIEADRSARLNIINKLVVKLEASDSDRAARLEIIKKLSSQVAACESDRIARGELIDDLSRRLEASDKDRADRLEVIEKLSSQLAACESDRIERGKVIEDLSSYLNKSGVAKTLSKVYSDS
jgi:glycosyltransferase involved in cell wall biosynthesis